MAQRDRLGVREYLSRDWGALERLDALAWIESRERTTPADRLAAVGRLRAWTHGVSIAASDVEARRLDIESHARVARLLRRADERRAR